MAETPPVAYKVRPGDRWPGCTVSFEREDVDFTDATIECSLTRYPGGPVVFSLSPANTLADGSFTSVFAIAGVDTTQLVFGVTYHGFVRVTVPNETPGAEPVYGPQTVFTWTLEAVDHAVLEDADEVSAASEASGSIGPTGPVGPTGATGPAGPTGPAGAGLALGQDLYIHPTSGNLYMRISTNYYRGTPTLVDSVPTIAWDTVGTLTPT